MTFVKSAYARFARFAFAAIAIAVAVPIGLETYDRLKLVNERARARLIEQHELWKLDANYQGRPAQWTRFAARLLNDGQLLARVAIKYAGQSREIELEYRRDLTIARAEVVVAALAIWALPLALSYGIFRLLRRKGRSAPPVKIVPASAADPRYLPPSA